MTDMTAAFERSLPQFVAIMAMVVSSVGCSGSSKPGESNGDGSAADATTSASDGMGEGDIGGSATNTPGNDGSAGDESTAAAANSSADGSNDDSSMSSGGAPNTADGTQAADETDEARAVLPVRAGQAERPAARTRRGQRRCAMPASTTSKLGAKRSSAALPMS